MNSKTSLIVFAFLVGITLLANAVGFVGFSCPEVTENDPLLDPVAVRSVDGNTLVLADGRELSVDTYVEDLAQTIRGSGRRVDVDEIGVVYVSERGWLCGTRWAAPVRIPLFADEVPINHREPVGFVARPADQEKHRH